MLLLMTIEIYRWGPELQAATLGFYRQATDSLWTAWPVAEQSPLSAWCRTSMLGPINRAVPVLPAQALAMGLWVLFIGITL